jgi:hypothetical protein
MPGSNATGSGQVEKQEDDHAHESRNVFQDMEVGERSTQVFVSTTRATFSVARAKVAADALQLSGQMADTTVQQVSKDHGIRHVGQRSDDPARQQAEETAESTEVKFLQSYGTGHVV